jgi:hypothetical protein
VIIWLNEAFGAGKTATARELAATVPDVRLFDPEMVGYLLRHGRPGLGLTLTGRAVPARDLQCLHIRNGHWRGRGPVPDPG